MAWYMNAEAVADIESRDPDNPQLAIWRATQIEYTNSAAVMGAATKNFWIVIKMPSAKFSENVEFLDDPPMIIPKEGHGVFAGVASTKEELDVLVQKDSHKNVYFVFQAKIQGAAGWRDLLTFLGSNDMLTTFT